ncbi:hypothetical protein HDK77DRAFT_300020 [Phyllosticta capitalensis]
MMLMITSYSLADAVCGPTFSNIFLPNCCFADDITDFNTEYGWQNWLNTGLEIKFTKGTKDQEPVIHVQCKNEYGCDVITLEICLHDPNLDPPAYKKINRDCIYQQIKVQGNNNACTTRGWWIGYHRLLRCNTGDISLAEVAKPQCPPDQSKSPSRSMIFVSPDPDVASVRSQVLRPPSSMDLFVLSGCRFYLGDSLVHPCYSYMSFGRSMYVLTCMGRYVTNIKTIFVLVCGFRITQRKFRVASDHSSSTASPLKHGDPFAPPPTVC